ncbi:MAG: hypothetical protein IMY76_07395 [Chloroflexi bacterium]|nr:hypothetical protein [Chloroflexota bacterium]
MSNHPNPTIKSFIPTAMLLILMGGGGLMLVLSQTLPSLGPRWLFFFFTVLAVTGIILPIAAFLNRRFPTTPAVSKSTVLREAIFAGIFVPTLAWLQLNRALTGSLLIILVIGFVLLEWFMRLREQSRWKP